MLTLISLAPFLRQMASHFVKEFTAMMQNSVEFRDSKPPGPRGREQPQLVQQSSAENMSSVLHHTCLQQQQPRPFSAGELQFCPNEGHICTVDSCLWHVHLHYGDGIKMFFLCLSWEKFSLWGFKSNIFNFSLRDQELFLKYTERNIHCFLAWIRKLNIQLSYMDELTSTALLEVRWMFFF